MNYLASDSRYASMLYNRCGNSGLRLPAISLGLWHNFGDVDIFGNARTIVLKAFDIGITHFDLANNYGPPPGAAERNFGRIIREDLKTYRDEIIISSKAGYLMWPGPYGEWGSRKNLVASIDCTLKRLGIDYVDIFYHHRPDPDTPIEETIGALDYIVRSGRALYAGISNYSAEQTVKAAEIFKKFVTPCLIHQPSYNMFNRWIEGGLLEVLERKKIGCIAFSPLAQGLLTDKYLSGIPQGSRASKPHSFLKPVHITEKKLHIVRELDKVAKERGQNLAQMSIAWVLRHSSITSALIGVSRVEQVEDAVGALKNLSFTQEELLKIDKILEENQ